jgi:drug/metabolite transporter (DMT)-like permease
MLRSERLRADLTLLLVALVWGCAFAAQRFAAQYTGPFLFNGVRFFLGALVLLGVWLVSGRRRAPLPTRRGAWGWAVAGGGLLFAASALQQAGMRWTTAANAGFLTALYVVLVPVLLLLLQRQRSGWRVWAAVGLAMLGTYFLSGLQKLQLNPGDALEVLGAVTWALHVILVAHVAQRLEPLSFSTGQFLVCGALNLALGLVLEHGAWPGLARSVWAIAYTGIFSVGVGYTLQVVAQRHAPPTDAALILSLETVFAALGGWLLLGELLGPWQWVGGALILGAVLLAQIRPKPA